MPADTNRLINADAIDEHTLEPVVKFLLVAGAIFLLWGLVSALPGIDLLIPTTSVTLGTAIGAVLTLALVAALGFVAWKIEPMLAESLSGPVDIADDFASLVKHLVLFVTVLVTHRGLEPLIEPALGTLELAWTYDAVFLGLALIPTTVVVSRMFGNLSEVTAIVTSRVRGSTAARPSGRFDSSFSDAEDG